MKLPTWLSNSGFGLLLVGLGAFLLYIFTLLGWGPVIKLPVQPVDGTSEFAIFYLMAQLIERTIEPFSEAKATKKKALFGDTEKIKKNENEDEKTTRTISMWGLASLLGMTLSFGTVGLFQVVGVTFMGWQGHAVDSIFSGIIIGGGTKPLHDLISYLQKEKQQ